MRKLIHKTRDLGLFRAELLSFLLFIRIHRASNPNPVIYAADENHVELVKRYLNSIKEEGVFEEEIDRIKVIDGSKETKGQSGIISYV